MLQLGLASSATLDVSPNSGRVRLEHFGGKSAISLGFCTGVGSKLSFNCRNRSSQRQNRVLWGLHLLADLFA
jgi:hypothetical protein